LKKIRPNRSRRTETPRSAPQLNPQDRILVALSDKALMRRVLETTHSASEWASAAITGSKTELNVGLELIDSERRRLEERLVSLRLRAGAIRDEVKQSATAAECERIESRLDELTEQRKHVTSLQERVRPDLEIEAIEWQRPLTVGEGEVEVVGYVDLWVSVRTSAYRVQQGADPWDPEGRARYEGATLHHLIRTVALHVAPSIRSLSALIRQVRFVQTYAKNSLPLVVTCTPVGADVLAGQGIPVYVWEPERDASPVRADAALTHARSYPAALGPAPADGASMPSLPSPRPSLPPAPLT
jgi:hypothetical protein